MGILGIVNEIKGNSIEKLVYQGKVMGYRIGVYSPYTAHRYYIDVRAKDLTEKLKGYVQSHNIKSSELQVIKTVGNGVETTTWLTQQELNGQRVSELSEVQGGNKMLALLEVSLNV